MSKSLKFTLNIFALFISSVFTYYLPSILWNFSWQEFISVLQNKENLTTAIKTLISYIQSADPTSNNISNWIITKLFLCVCIGLGTFILLSLIIHTISNAIDKTENNKT